MSEPDRDDSAFAWKGDDESSVDRAPAHDLRRVGLVLGVALMVLIGLGILLLQVLGDVFSDMWNSVFTF